MSASDATKVALNGLSDLWTIGNFDSLSLSLYGYNTLQTQQTYNQYTIGYAGERCN